MSQAYSSKQLGFQQATQRTNAPFFTLSKPSAVYTAESHFFGSFQALHRWYIVIANNRSWLLLNNEKLTRLLLQVVCILLSDSSLVLGLVDALLPGGRTPGGAADQEHLLDSKKKEKKLEKVHQSVFRCVGRVVGMCGVCLLLGLGDHGLGLLVCLPLGPVVLVSCGGSIKQSSPYQMVSQYT